MDAEISLYDGDRDELADDREIAQPEQMAQVDASGSGDSLHPRSLPSQSSRSGRAGPSPAVLAATRRAISSARHAGHRQRAPVAGCAPAGIAGIAAHQQVNGRVRAPQSNALPQRGQRLLIRPGVAAGSVIANGPGQAGMWAKRSRNEHRRRPQRPIRRRDAAARSSLAAGSRAATCQA
ncbi:histidine kinase domain protein [Burkholderia mallei]|nr:histidine kinase domain protein [Burkholderia pseudomallei]KOS75000.1 histidine kinase domain protein [Burkholderia mallei]KOS91028.1 histidine kinase domain protein [Burkholderia mallei]KOS91157.1 histidine kinase domain protein [Burkholderia mallei]